jgi:chemotaxis protein MotB
MAELLPSQMFLTQALDSEIKSGKVQVHMEARGLVISLRESALFSTGEDAIAAGAHSTIEKIARSVGRLPNPVRLEGHTDAIPIHNSRFRSNWELSAARSIAMLELLATDFEVPRAHNRRVDVVILNEKGLVAEPRGADRARAQDEAGAEEGQKKD